MSRIKGKTSTNIAALELRPNGDHYSVKTAYRGKWKDLKKLRDNREAAEGSPWDLKSPHPPVHQHGTDGEVLPHGLKRPLHHERRENSPLPMGQESIKERGMQAIPLYPPSHDCWSRNTSQSQQGDSSSCENSMPSQSNGTGFLIEEQEAQ